MNPGVPGVERLEEIGRGGSGVVYRGWQPDFGRWVAIKVFSADEDLRRLERERLAVGRLSDHPGIAPVFGGGITSDNRPFLIMAFMEGGSLSDRIRRYGPLTVAQSAALGQTLAAALQVAHDHGIWHRDIKPANILFDRFGTPRLADFGIAHIGEDGFRTETGLISGTAAYMAPELLDGHPFTAAADVFSLGATIYFALAGRAMFIPRADESAAAFLLRRLYPTEPPPFPAEVPTPLRDLILEATVPRVEDRLATAGALAERLARTGLGAPADPSPMASPSDIPPRATPSPTDPPVTAPPLPIPAMTDSDPTTIGTPPAPPAQPGPWGNTTQHPEEHQPPARRIRRWPIALAAVSLFVLLVGGGTLVVRTVSWSTVTPLSHRSATTSGTPVTGQQTSEPGTTPTASASASSIGPGASDRPQAIAAIHEALDAFRKAAGSNDPTVVEVYFDPFFDSEDSNYASMLMVKNGYPNLADQYYYSDGEVSEPEAPAIPPTDVPRQRWNFSDVSWDALDSMLTKTESICRAVMTRENYPDEPDGSGHAPGLSSIDVKRDLIWSNGQVVFQVYFHGGAYWDGGYVRYSASGVLLKDYCSN